MTQKWPQIRTVIFRIFIGGKIAWFALCICGNLWVTQYNVHNRVYNIFSRSDFGLVSKSTPGPASGVLTPLSPASSKQGVLHSSRRIIFDWYNIWTNSELSGERSWFFSVLILHWTYRNIYGIYLSTIW